MIVHIIAGLGQGGAETALYRLIEASSDPQKHHVVSLAGDGVFGPRLRALGCSVTVMDFHRPALAILNFPALVRLIRRLKPRVVQTWMYHADLVGGIAARLAGARVCWGVRHSNLDASANKRSTLLVARVCALLSRIIPKRIVCCSEAAIATHLQFGYADRFDYIPNGINVGLFASEQPDRDTVRQALGITRVEHVYANIGRWHPQKDHHSLVAAFRKLPKGKSRRLVLVGKGLTHENPDFSALVQGIEDQVIALGPRKDIAAILSAIDLFVLSSIGEGFPNVVAEAMSAGIPCIVTDVGDAAAIVGATGWVVAPADPAALARAMEAAEGESATATAARSVAARARILNEFTVQRMIQAYERTWSMAQG